MVKLRYKCVRHTDYNEILCENMKEAQAYLYDMKKYLLDYQFVKLVESNGIKLI